MESAEDSASAMQRFSSSFGTGSNNVSISPLFGDSSSSTTHVMPQFPQIASPQSHNNNHGGGSSSSSFKKHGMPPSHPNQHPHLPPSSPYSRTGSQQMGLQNNNGTSPRPSSHTRSSSQPPFFSLESFNALSPPYHHIDGSDSEALNSLLMDERSGGGCDASNLLLHGNLTSGNAMRLVNQGLPPRRGHRRSNSDTPLGFNAMIQSTPQLIPTASERLAFDNKSGQFVKRESEWSKDRNVNAEGSAKEKQQREGEIADELFRTYMNLDSIDTMNMASPQTEDKDGDSMASRKTIGGDNSDNEVESGINRITNSLHVASLSLPSDKRERGKRSAVDDIAPSSRHYRSISMDSFMESFNFGDESPQNNPPSLGAPVSQLSPSNSMDGSLTKFNMDLGSGDFSGIELKKIMGNEQLSDIALSDPKRAKRILANRQSAARSKERKVRYISELEHKVQTLQAEATTLSAQVTVLQRDASGLTSHNNELKFRLRAMEQQAQLREALHETLTSEVERLKIVSAGQRGESHPSNHRPQFKLPSYHLQQNGDAGKQV